MPRSANTQQWRIQDFQEGLLPPEFGDTVNKRAACIPLECILVVHAVRGKKNLNGLSARVNFDRSGLCGYTWITLSAVQKGEALGGGKVSKCETPR